MEYTLDQANQSNYQITLKLSPEDMSQHKDKVLKNFQKEMKEPGFRKGHVPLDIVEKKVSQEYLLMGMLEEAIHAGTKQLLDEHSEIKFIGSIYDLQREEKDDQTHISFKLDVYPEVEAKNDNWTSITIDPIDPSPTDQEIDETILNLRKQYAQYEPTDTVADGTIFKVKFQHIDTDGNEVDKGTVFLGEEEIQEFPDIKTLFYGKKQGDIFEIDYTPKTLPPMLHLRTEGKKADKLACEIVDVRKVALPELTEENIQRFFGNEDVKTLDQLKEKVTELIAKQKNEVQLMQAIDKMLGEAQSSLDVTIPKTLIDEEKKSRMKSLQERMGGEEGFKQYLEKMGDQEQKKMHQQIDQAAQQSLEKFFMLRYITEALEIKDPDWQTPLDVETKLYQKMKKDK